jgi:hypothetical protein
MQPDANLGFGRCIVELVREIALFSINQGACCPAH